MSLQEKIQKLHHMRRDPDKIPGILQDPDLCAECGKIWPCDTWEMAVAHPDDAVHPDPGEHKLILAYKFLDITGRISFSVHKGAPLLESDGAYHHIFHPGSTPLQPHEILTWTVGQVVPEEGDE